ATDFFGIRVSSARILGALRDAERAFVEAGLSNKLTRKGEGATVAEVAREATARFFAEVGLASVTRGEAAGSARGQLEGRMTISRDFWSGEVLASYHRLDGVLEALGAYAESHLASEAIEVAARRTSQLRGDL